ncbi:MAG: serine hydrolase domain-containing protein, partial [Fulvivirga sp.]
MNRSLRIITIILLCAVAAQAQDKKAKELDAFIKRGITDWQIPGLAVTVVKDGQAVFTKTYGVRNQDDGTKVDEHTLFSMASTTKAMVAMAMAMLVDEGKISWTDKVTDHVPYFKLSDPYITADATVKDLLTHNLGLGNADLIWYGIELDAEETIKRMRHAPIAYPLRGGYTYQNIMYAVAGEVIKAASGVEWHDFVKTRILDPLGMKDTKLVSKDVKAVDNRVTPHLLNDEDKRITFPTTFGDGIGPAGMIWSSISDVNKYLKFIQQKGVNQ